RRRTGAAVSPPPLLLGAGLIFWGWQTGFFLVALPLAVLIEAARALTWRLDLSSTDFHRVTDLCTLLIVVAGVYLFSTTGTARPPAARRRPAGDDAPVPVAAAAPVSPHGQPGLQRRRQDPADRVLLGVETPGRSRPLGQARAGGSRLSLLRALRPLGQRREPAHARVLRGPLRPRGLGALVLALAALLTPVVGAARGGGGRGGLRRPHRAPPAPAGRRADGVRLHLQPRQARGGPVPGDDGHRPPREPQVLRSDR